MTIQEQIIQEIEHLSEPVLQEILNNIRQIKAKPAHNLEGMILEPSQRKTESNPYPLRGTVIRYDDPFEPAVPVEDWEVLH